MKSVDHLAEALWVIFEYWMDNYDLNSGECLALWDYEGYFLSLLKIKENDVEYMVDVDIENMFARYAKHDLISGEIWCHDEYWDSYSDMIVDLGTMSRNDWIIAVKKIFTEDSSNE